MKSIVKISGLIFIFLFAFSFASHAQPITAHCSGGVKITDSNFSAGDSYIVYVRVETTDPWTSGWEQTAIYYATGSNLFGITDVDNVPKPNPIPQPYYSLRLYGVKISGGGEAGTANNASVAKLDASNNLTATYEIELKFD